MDLLPWTLWKRTLFFNNATRLPTSNTNTDCLFEIPIGILPPIEDPARVALRITKFQCPFVWGTLNRLASPPGSNFVLTEYINGNEINEVQIDFWDYLPTSIPYMFLNGIELVNRLNLLLNNHPYTKNHYIVSFDLNSSFIRIATDTTGATFRLNFDEATNQCALAMGFQRNTITDEVDELFSTQPILSQGFLNIDLRFPQLSAGSYSDNDLEQPLHPSNVFGRVSLGKYNGLNFINEEFNTYHIVSGLNQLSGNQFRIQLTTERPSENVPIPAGVHWNIELEIIGYIPAYLIFLQPSRLNNQTHLSSGGSLVYDDKTENDKKIIQ